MSSLTLPLNMLTHLNLRNIILKKNKITLNWPLRNYQYPRNYPVKYRSNNVGFDGCLSRSSPELGMNFHSACGLLVINLLFTVTVTLNATKRTRTVCDCLFKVDVENASGLSFLPSHTLHRWEMHVSSLLVHTFLIPIPPHWSWRFLEHCNAEGHIWAWNVELRDTDCDVVKASAST